MAWLAAWRALAAKELAGAGSVDSLVERTLEGLDVPAISGDGPLGDAESGGWPGQAPFVRGSQVALNPLRPWWNFSTLLPAPALAANRQAREELDGGAGGLELPAAAAGWHAADLRQVLDGVHLEAMALHLEPGPEPVETVRAILELARAARADGMGWSLGVDLLRTPAAAGIELEQAATMAAPNARTFLADATPFHEAGAHAVTELALLLAASAESLRSLERAGCPPDRALTGLAWRLPMERDFFGGIVKLRAARWLWNRMAEACAVTAVPPPFIHALTSPRTRTQSDPHTNLVRATVQSAAAIAGGADALSVQAFDAHLQQPSALGRRLARNLQLVLQHESGLGAVADPAGGSPYVEARTRALAEAAWEEFRGFERAGGLLHALRSGSLRIRLDAEWEARRARIAAGKEIVLGVNLHAPAGAAKVAAPSPRADGIWNLPRRREEDAWQEGA